MLLPFFHSTKDEQGNEHPLVITHEQFHNTSEGSEFLDELRIEDLTIPRIEESVAVGNPDNIL